MPYGDIDLGQHWWHQAITNTWTNVDSLSVPFKLFVAPVQKHIQTTTVTDYNFNTIVKLFTHLKFWSIILPVLESWAGGLVEPRG